MNADLKKYGKYVLYAAGGVVVIYGTIEGIKYLRKGNEGSLIDGKPVKYTMPDGTVILLSGDAVKPPAKSDLDAMVNAGKSAGINPTAGWESVRAVAAKNLNRYETQRLTYIFEKWNANKTQAGLTNAEWKEYGQLMTSLKS